MMCDVLPELKASGFTLVDTLLPVFDGCLHTMHHFPGPGTKCSSGRIIYKMVLRERTKGYVKLSHISRKTYQSSVSYLAALFSHHEVNDKIVAKDVIYFNAVFSETISVL